MFCSQAVQQRKGDQHRKKQDGHRDANGLRAESIVQRKEHGDEDCNGDDGRQHLRHNSPCGNIGKYNPGEGSDRDDTQADEHVKNVFRCDNGSCRSWLAVHYRAAELLFIVGKDAKGDGHGENRHEHKRGVRPYPRRIQEDDQQQKRQDGAPFHSQPRVQQAEQLRIHLVPEQCHVA